jgi:hypothetical protein
MRIERKGSVAKLTPRLERFFVEALRGVLLDNVQHAEARKADYKCLGGLVVIELKTLEDDASERMDNLIGELRQRPDWPAFLGSASMHSVLKHVNEPEAVSRQLVDRVGRAIKRHIRKANKQLAAHEKAFPRKNTVRIMVLVNEDHETYDPETVAYIAHHLLSRREHGALLYPHIDAVIFLSERHAGYINRQITFPIVCIEGVAVENAVWKRNVTELFLTRWATWCGLPLYHSDMGAQEFATIDHIPEEVKRYEQWELDYKRNPYMRGFTNEQLRGRFDEMMCVSSLAFIKGSPLKPSNDAIMWSLSCMSHMTIEMNGRAIPVTQFMLAPERLASAARRMRFPANVVSWFEAGFGRSDCSDINPPTP